MSAARSPRAISLARPPENYLASVSDLMVGLLFLFILLLMALALDVRTPAPAAPGVVAAYDARDKALLDIQQELKGRGVIVQVDLQDGIVRLPEELLFAQGQARLRPGGDVAIKRVSSQLMYFLPHCPQLEALVVEGHTDDSPVHGAVPDPLGTYRDNWDLAYMRAKETFQGLVAATPALGRLQNDRGLRVLGLGAFGPDRPVGDNRTPEGRQLNRRIDLRVVLGGAAPHAHQEGRPMRSPTPLVALLFVAGAALVCTNQPAATAVVAVGIAAFAAGAFQAFRKGMRRVAVDAAMLEQLADAQQATGEGLGAARAPSSLAEAWRGYREALVRDPADGRLRAGEPAAAHFNAATVVERQVNLGLYQALPGLLVGIGICFTFLGLAIALQQASLGVSSQDVAVTQAALKGLYGAASFKFVTSIVALACSVLFTAAEKRVHHEVMGALDHACMALDRKFPPLGREALLSRPSGGAAPVDADAIGRAVAAAIDPDAIGRAVAAALAPTLEALRPTPVDLGAQLEATARQAAQLHQGLLTELFTGQNQILEGALGRQRQGLEHVVGELERVLKRDLELRAAGQAEHGRVILAMREAITDLQQQAGSIGQASAERIAQMAELTRLVGDQVGAVDRSYAGLVASLETAMAGSNEQLKRYLETAETRQTHFFDTYDMAVTKLYEKLLQAANYLAEVAATR